MDYMGFGMQKWIYSRKSRKPFTKESTPGYDTLPGHASKEFSGFGAPSQNMESIDERILSGKRSILRRWIRKRTGDIFIVIIMLAVFVGIAIRFAGQAGIWPDKNKSLKQREETESREAYVLSMEYGIRHFEKAEYDEAIREFKNAERLYPENKEALEALAGTYYILCVDSGPS